MSMSPADLALRRSEASSSAFSGLAEDLRRPVSGLYRPDPSCYQGKNLKTRSDVSFAACSSPSNPQISPCRSQLYHFGCAEIESLDTRVDPFASSRPPNKMMPLNLALCDGRRVIFQVRPLFAAQSPPWQE